MNVFKRHNLQKDIKLGSNFDILAISHLALQVTFSGIGVSCNSNPWLLDKLLDHIWV